jgi:hypothetical protein
MNYGIVESEDAKMLMYYRHALYYDQISQVRMNTNLQSAGKHVLRISEQDAAFAKRDNRI